MKYLIILFGAPGCGKGHLSEQIIKVLNEKISPDEIFYISTGDLIRNEIANESEIGKQIKELVQSGQLVPDNIVDTLVAQAINRDEYVKILDGYPRTSSQLDFLAKQLKDEKGKITVLTIFRDTPEEVILERVKKRRVCAKCKKTHTVDDGCCPHCGGESIIRKDDAVIEARLEAYKKNTLPLWDKIDSISHTLRVDGLRESEEVAREIIEILL